MDELIYEPLEYYEKVAKQSHKDNISEHLDRLTNASGIDVEANRSTVAKYDKKLKHIEQLNKRRTLYVALRVLMIILCVLSVIFVIVGINNGIGFVIAGVVLFTTAMLVIFLKLNKLLKNLTGILEKENEEKDALLREAYAQMSAMNRSFSDTDALRIIEKTMPGISFERSFDEGSEKLMTEHFDLNTYNNQDMTVTDTVSGVFNKNPFLFERRRVHTMGAEIYHGYKTISWRETYRDSDGKTRTRTRTQTLHASVTKPKPVYSYDTVLNYGSDAAPDLTFSRQGRHIEKKNEKQLKRLIRKEEKEIKTREKKQLTSAGGSFTAMNNTEFEALFNVDDRDNEVQFRVLFTPLAQTNLVELLKSHVSYGDDFDFYKVGKNNLLRSDHAQNWIINADTSNYVSHSYDLTVKKFTDFNVEYFKSLYFDLAPLLSIPVYQDEPSELEGERKIEHLFSTRECEVLANAIGPQRLSHPDTVTDTIYKAYTTDIQNGLADVCIEALSYVSEDRLDLIPVLGGDGRIHPVPVPWKEYIPLRREEHIKMRRIIDSDDMTANEASVISKNGILAYLD